MPHPNTGLPVAERFELYVDRSGDCHLWTGGLNRGYGHFRYEGRTRKAHHVALLLAGVDVPEDMTVDHVRARGCRHKNCVRVEHLEIVTSRENTMRSTAITAANAHKTHCKRGHEFTPDNTMWADGRHGPTRRCRECSRAQCRDQYWKRKVAG